MIFRIGDIFQVIVIFSKVIANFSNKGIVSVNMVESHDSCYSSCSEESHSSLSREPSDNIAKEIAQLNVTDTKSSTTARGIEQQHLFLQNIDFAIRLGYSIEQLKTVLGKLGMSARQVKKLIQIQLIPFVSNSILTSFSLFNFIYSLFNFLLDSISTSSFFYFLIIRNTFGMINFI